MIARLAYVVLLAACAKESKHATTPTIENRGPETRGAPVVTQRKDPTSITKRCPELPWAKQAGVRVSTYDDTASVHDLCMAVDQSIALLPNPAALQPGKFALDVVLNEIDRSNMPEIKCRVFLVASINDGHDMVANEKEAVRIKTPSAAPSDIATATRDCIDAAIDDLIRKRTVPKLEAHIRNSSANP